MRERFQVKDVYGKTLENCIAIAETRKEIEEIQENHLLGLYVDPKKIIVKRTKYSIELFGEDE